MRTKKRGFSLIEVLLVLVVLSTFILITTGYVQQSSLNTRVDRTAIQMQQILNAGMAYYVNVGYWPSTVSDLQVFGYLPSTINGPFGNTYEVRTSSTTKIFYVSTTIENTPNAAAITAMIAGKLPFGTSTADTVEGGVTIPGQDLNNATALNFAGMYHHGACIPVPVCPQAPATQSGLTGALMEPKVFVIPVSVSGYAQDGSTTNVFPLSSFTAYATGGNDTSPDLCTGSTAVYYGGALSTSTECTTGGITGEVSDKYWRACINITTERGNVNAVNRSLWGEHVTLAAFTRCQIADEAQGSAFTVYGN